MTVEAGVKFRGFKPNLFLALVLSGFAVYVTANPTPANSSAIDADIKFIKKAISLTPLQRFTTYPVVVQEAGTNGGDTLYKHYVGPTKTGNLVFRRKGSDLHKSVVILDENEDHLTYTKEGEDNRIYVVLIQNPVTDNYYHVVFAYARNVPPNDIDDNSVVTINRDKRRIEWDVWDQRGANKNKASSFGWTTCLESFFIPCKPYFKDQEENLDYSEESSDGTRLVGAQGLKSVPNTDKRIAFQTENGLDAGMNFDFFGDLDDNIEQALMVGTVVDTLTDTVQFFTDSAIAFSKTDDGNASATAIKAVQAFLSQDFVKILLLDLKNIGNHSLQSIDGAQRGMNQLIAEGYRILQGLLNNSDSDHFPEKLAIGVFAEENERHTGNGAKTRGGRNMANKFKTTTTEVVSTSSHSSNSNTKLKWKGFGPAPDFNKLLASMNAGRSSRKKRQWGVSANGNYVPGGSGGHGQSKGGMYTGAGNWMPAGGYSGTAPTGANKYTPTVAGNMAGEIKGVDWRVFCARPNLSQGEKGWCGCHKGKELSFGASEGLGDVVSMALSNKKVSNDPSIADPLFNTGLGVVFCGSAAAAIDLADVVAKPLGLSPLLGQASNIAGTILGASGGGPVMLGHLIHQGVKAAGQATGLGGLIGMKGGPQGQQGGPQGGGGGILGLGGLLGGKAVSASNLPEVTVLPDVETDVEIFGHIGWRTQDVKDSNDLSKDIVIKHISKEAFVGLGVCPYEPIPAYEFERANSLLEVSKLYHRVLRTDCLEKHAERLIDLVDEGHLHLNDDKTMSISDNCPSIKTTVLSERQIDRLSLAFSFAIFSQVYSDEVGNVTLQPRNAIGLKISRPVHVMLQFAVNFLQQTRRVAPIHFIKLARDLAQTIKTTFVKSLQDFYRFKDCAKCSGEVKTEAENDALTLLGLFQFIIEGLGPIEHTGSSVQTTLDVFFKLNKNALARKIQLYTQHE